jgi:hypothetical protein
VATSTLLLLFLPFLLSLAGRGGKALCLLSSVMALLKSVDPYAAVLPWTLGMAIAVISIHARIRQRRSV